MSTPEGFDPGAEFLGRYRLSKRLGEGRLGVVYLAEGASGQVAARFFRGLDPAAVQGALAKLEAFRALAHPSLVPVVDQGEGWAAYAFVEGASVARLLEKHGRLAPAAALRIIRGAAEGLAALHAAGLAHGSVTAGNVLLDRKGTPKLADGGLAPLSRAAAAGRAPDLAQDLKDLGALLHRSLAGGGEGPPAGRLDQLLDEVPAELADHCAALAAGYVASAGEVVQAMDGFLARPEVGSRKQAYQPRAAGAPAAAPAPAPAPAAAPEPAAAPPPAPAPEPPPPAAPQPAPAAPKVDSEFHQRKAAAVLAATTTSSKKAPRALKLNMGKREGPTWGNVFLIVLVGGLFVGGIGYKAFQKDGFEADAQVTDLAPRERPKVADRDLPQVAAIDDEETAASLARRIVEQPKLAKRAQLIQLLLERYPNEAALVLTRTCRGANDRLKVQLLPVIERLDDDGGYRGDLLEWAAREGGAWAVRLTRSLVRTGSEGPLKEVAAKQGDGALVALAAAHREDPQLPFEAANRFERRFFDKGRGDGEKRLPEWLEAAGGGAVGRWVCSTLLKRADNEQVQEAILAVLMKQDPSDTLFDALAGTVAEAAFAWAPGIQEACIATLTHLAGDDPGRKQRLDELQRQTGL